MERLAKVIDKYIKDAEMERLSTQDKQVAIMIHDLTGSEPKFTFGEKSYQMEITFKLETEAEERNAIKDAIRIKLGDRIADEGMDFFIVRYETMPTRKVSRNGKLITYTRRLREVQAVEVVKENELLLQMLVHETGIWEDNKFVFVTGNGTFDNVEIGMILLTQDGQSYEKMTKREFLQEYELK